MIHAPPIDVTITGRPAPSPSRSASGGESARLLDFDVVINDRLNFEVLFKDIFRKGIYHFECERPDPRVLDCGSNIGVSVLYFKHVYPGARVTAFEPDPAVLPFLRENLGKNGLDDVEVVPAAVAGFAGQEVLHSDEGYASALSRYDQGGHVRCVDRTEVPCVRLREYLSEPVDFLKLNVEGAEADVLADCADRLRTVSQMVLEYHHLPGLRRSLHEILGLLHEQGFDYLINDFDRVTNPHSEPPFRLGPHTRYYLLIYAKRVR